MTNSEQYGSTYSTAAQVPPAGAYAPGEYGTPTGQSDIYGTPAQGDQSSTGGAVKETAGVAKDQAATVAGGAADAASHVAGVAKEQAGQVTAEAGRQVKNLVGQARNELSDQAQTQQQRAASGLHSLGDQLRAMATGDSPQSGVATDLAQQAASKVHDLARWLENRDPADLLQEVRSFARQRPGTFLAIALGAGIVTGRLARGMTTNPDEAGTNSGDGRARGYEATPATYAIPPVTGYETSQPSGYAPTTAGYGTSGAGYGAGPAYGAGQPYTPGQPSYAPGQPSYAPGQGSDWTAGQPAGQWGETR